MLSKSCDWAPADAATASKHMTANDELRVPAKDHSSIAKSITNTKSTFKCLSTRKEPHSDRSNFVGVARVQPHSSLMAKKLQRLLLHSGQALVMSSIASFGQVFCMVRKSSLSSLGLSLEMTR